MVILLGFLRLWERILNVCFVTSVVTVLLLKYIWPYGTIFLTTCFSNLNFPVFLIFNRFCNGIPLHLNVVNFTHFVQLLQCCIIPVSMILPSKYDRERGSSYVASWDLNPSPSVWATKVHASFKHRSAEINSLSSVSYFFLYFSSAWLCFNISTFPQHVFLFPLHGTHLLLTSDLTNYCRLFVLQLELSWATVHSNSAPTVAGLDIRRASKTSALRGESFKSIVS
jgi:hypothetical protein